MALLALCAGSALGDGLAFEDRARSLGLDRLRWAGHMPSGRIVTSIAAGVSWGDFDGDGWLDLYLPQGGVSPKVERTSRCGHLLRGRPGFRLEEATERSGITACGWGMGSLAEDLDRDGDLDLLLTFVDHVELWLNGGDGTFEERSSALGLDLPGWSTGAASFDADGDGDLDLYVARYLDTTIADEQAESTFRLRLLLEYGALSDALFLRQDGRFEAAGAELLAAPSAPGRGLSVLAADLDLDGRADVVVANDQSENFLFHNRGGSLEEVAAVAGVAVGRAGKGLASMGLAVGDVDGDGLPDLVVTNFAREPVQVHLNLGLLTFVEQGRELGLEAAQPFLGWSTELVDFDADSELDLFVANMHLLPNWFARIAAWLDHERDLHTAFGGPYAQPLLVYRGGSGRFEGAFADREPVAPLPPLTSRGAATADLDRDGGLDLVLYSAHWAAGFSESIGPPTRLLHNVSELGHWTEIDLRPPGLAAPLPGSRVTARTPSRTQVQQLTSGGTFLGGSARPIHFGLGTEDTVTVELAPLAGRRRRIEGLPANHHLVVAVADPPSR